MSGRAELPEVLAFVRKQVRTFSGTYDDIGVHVNHIDADTDNGKPFPDMLIYIEHEDVDGERLARINLEHNGNLMAPGDAGTVAFGITETYAAEIARLPRSNRQ